MNMMPIETNVLDWGKGEGLLPAIVQDHLTREVLMLGFMNQAALENTLLTKKVTFYSRTKKRLWTKGETSGNTLQLVKIYKDCDADTLLILAEPNGPCCHLETESCFQDKVPAPINILFTLEKLIQTRFNDKLKNSYINNLFEQGAYKIAQKVGEEGVEVALAAVSNKKQDVINESADLIFHLLILLKQNNVTLEEVLQELAYRRANAES